MSTAMTLLYMRLEYLYTNFLLLKLLVNQSDDDDHNTLTQTSHEVLSLLLSVIKKRNLLMSYRSDLEWTMVFYAMPCASVLLLELFRQVRRPQCPHTLNRSLIIQDVSVLISCCEWLTEPGQGNYDLCRRAQSIFSRSLDQILNHSSEVPPSLNESNGQPEAESKPTSNVLFDEIPRQIIPPSVNDDALGSFVQDPEWSAWLDSMDLMADPWLGLVDHGDGDGQTGL